MVSSVPVHSLPFLSGSGNFGTQMPYHCTAKVIERLSQNVKEGRQSVTIKICKCPCWNAVTHQTAMG